MTSNNDIIRVLIVDDHTIVRKGIKALLAETSDIKVIGEAENGLEAIQAIQKVGTGCHFDGPADAEDGRH